MKIYICKIWESTTGTGQEKESLRLESWILHHLSVRNAGNGELWLWALHAEPPSEEVFHQVAVTESRSVPDAILAWTRVSTKEGITLPHLGKVFVWNVFAGKIWNIWNNVRNICFHQDVIAENIWLFTQTCFLGFSLTLPSVQTFTKDFPISFTTPPLHTWGFEW